jgi:hypothetical protein
LFDNKLTAGILWCMNVLEREVLNLDGVGADKSWD